MVRFPLRSALLSFGTALAIPLSCPAATTSITTSADGDAQTFGGDSLDAADVRLTTTQSGGLARNIILEFDLSAIPEGSTITGASLGLVKDGGFSNTSASANVHLLGYAGDGVVDISDFAALGTNVGDFVESVSPVPANGTAFNFTLSDVTPLQAALDSASNLLTIRLETDSFATLNFASLENTTYDAPSLEVTYVPEPGSAALLGAGLFALAIRRKR